MLRPLHANNAASCRRLEKVRLSSHILSLASLLTYIQAQPANSAAFQRPETAAPMPATDEPPPLYKEFAAIKLNELQGSGQKADQAFAGALKTAMQAIAKNSEFKQVSNEIFGARLPRCMQACVAT